MKDITLWKCDICGTKIVKMRHLPYTSDQSGYPDKITVKFEDGEELVYSR